MTALRVEGLTKHFPAANGKLVHAADDVSFTLGAGETLGLVGESGSGKTTTGRAVLRLIEPTAGRVWVGDVEVTALGKSALRAARRQMQLIFQDPYASLNPRMTAGEIVAEPLINFAIGTAAERHEAVARLFARVGLSADRMAHFPHQFSGGQRQRLGIARALALRPKLIVCDEPVSALDVSVQAQIVNLLMDLQRELGVAYLFIAHDLAVVRHISARVAVMYLGQIVEQGPRDAIFANPRHPYTQALLAAVPVPDPERRGERAVLEGEIPSPTDPPSGCRFRTRCPRAFARCAAEAPKPIAVGSGHVASCHLAEGA